MRSTSKKIAHALILLSMALPTVLGPIALFAPNVAFAQSNPCPAGYTASLPDAQGNVTCTDQALNSITVSPTGQAVSATLNNGTQTNANGQPGENGPISCSGTLLFMSSPFTCMFRWIVSLVASTLIYIAAWFLAIAGLIFNWLVDHTVVGFGTFYTTIKPAVENAWTAFRDIANILIIGIFTFIAISIILGISEFGQKKMIARVLIIAVLINFSLLFAKIIIDGSNFVATQLYSAAGFDTTQQNGGTVPSTGANPFTGGYAQAGIAGQFINLMGVTGFADTFNSVKDIADAKDNGWIALLHGVFAAIVLFAAAGVLFYGAFLLTSRAIILIFLMITASVAFASYLVPRWQKSHYGWTAWWESLVWGSIFAPLLMFFLWATLSVGYQLKSGANQGGGSLGKLLSDPTNTNNLNALFVYVIVLGLLFVSLKLTNTFSNKIGGIDFANALAASPFTLGSRFVAGPLGRQFLGRYGVRSAAAIDSEIDSEKKRIAAERVRAQREGRTFNSVHESKKLAELLHEKDRAEKLGKSSFNMMNTSLGKSLASNLGLKGLAAGADGKKPPNFADSAKARADHAAKAGAEATVSRDDARKIAEQAHAERKDERLRRRDENKQLVEGLKQSVESVKKSEDLDSKHAAAQERLRAAEEEGSRSRVRIEEEFRSGRISQQQRATQMQAETERINRAKGEVSAIQGRINTIKKPLDDAERNLRQSEADLKKSIDSETNKIIAAGVDQAQEVSAHLAEGAATKLTNTLRSAMGMEPVDDIYSKKARGLAKKKIKAADLKAKVEAERSILQDAGEPGGGAGGGGGDAH